MPEKLADLKKQLEFHYQCQCLFYSDIRGHLPILRMLAQECSSVVEIGLRKMISTWSILQGLSENPAKKTLSYLGIDIAAPLLSIQNLKLIKQIAKAHDIDFKIWLKNDMQIELPKTEMLFIDSLHTYCHLTYELEKFSSKTEKYIAMHDTSPPWGYADDSAYKGDYSEYLGSFDKQKRGLWTAIEDFLKRHPEWILHKRYLNDHGLTILKRNLKLKF